MNRSNTGPRSFSADQLHAALGDAGGPARPDYLPDVVSQAGRVRQRPARTFLAWWLPIDVAVPRQGVPRAAGLFAVLSLMVTLLVAGVVYIGSQRNQPERPPALPTTPGAWRRVVIDSGAEGGVFAVAAGPRGLLAAVGEGDESRLYFSADGRDWTRVPADQHGPVGHNGAALVATDQRFLLVGNDVLASEDGLSWQRIADSAMDPDLRAGTPIAAAVAGPGVVAVGSDNKAWYSTDGTDWTLADVPPAPSEPSQLERPLDRVQTQGAVEMLGVAVSGRNLIAWGVSSWIHDDNSGTFVPVLWASNDGLSWASVPVPQSTRYATVAGGPNGFVVEDSSDVWLSADVWFSADGRSWEHVAEDAFGPSRWPALHNDDGWRVEMHLRSIAAGAAGYIAVGADGVCMLDCPSAETVIWTSPDGRSWSRLPVDDRFGAPTGAEANVAAAWGSDFIVGGESDNRPAVWISGSEPAGNGANTSAAPAPANPTITPVNPLTSPAPGRRPTGNLIAAISRWR